LNQTFCPAAVLRRRTILPIVLAGVCATLSACTAMGGAGPSTRAIGRVPEQKGGAPAYLLDLTMDLANRAQSVSGTPTFADTMGGARPVGTVIGRGDTLAITIWEAPPAALFGSSSLGGRSYSDNMSALSQASGSSTARSSSMPDQVVNDDGFITVPFAGRIEAAGRTTQEVAQEIVRRLRGKAHLPQVDVAFSRNATRTATVVGEVAKSGMVELTAKGERILDALAQAGGTREPVNKMTVQLSRSGTVASMPLETVIRNPVENVVLAPGDVVTAYYQPLSFTVLGATGQNKEVPFEATGVTLAEALGRSGGLDEQRANPSGAFIFRMEDPRLLGLNPANPVRDTATGPVRVSLSAEDRVPVIYRVNLRDPATFFAARNFPMRDKDILYVSTAPIADIQKFVNIISSSIFPILSLENALRN
jgi:polysaccharide biosynthesis/export protein